MEREREQENGEYLRVPSYLIFLITTIQFIHKKSTQNYLYNPKFHGGTIVARETAKFL
jgi:hypothetical protein